MKKLLIADDAPSFSIGLKAVLEEEGYFVFNSSDGLEAFRIACSENPDLILLDLKMPPSGDYEGIEVIRKLKDNNTTKSIPVIMISAYGSVKDKELALNSGAKDYITKPFRIDDLVDKICKLLG